MGWAFLVDRGGMVRWSAHGEASAEEQETMVRLLGELKQRYETSTQARTRNRELAAGGEAVRRAVQ